MVFYLLSRLTMLTFGLLYPVFCSYKAIKEKNARAYNRWLIYWIVLALFISAEMVVEPLFFWFPFYYELKILLILCLASSGGPQFLYRRFIHPAIAQREDMIDDFIQDVNIRVTNTLCQWGSGLITSASQHIWQAALRVRPPLGVMSFGQDPSNRMITQGDAIDGFGAQNYAYSYERATLDAIMRSGDEEGMSSEEELPGAPAYFSSAQIPLNIPPEIDSPEARTRSRSKGRSKKRRISQGRRGRRNLNAESVEAENHQEEFQDVYSGEDEVENMESELRGTRASTRTTRQTRRRRAVQN